VQKVTRYRVLGTRCEIRDTRDCKVYPLGYSEFYSVVSMSGQHRPTPSCYNRELSPDLLKLAHTVLSQYSPEAAPYRLVKLRNYTIFQAVFWIRIRSDRHHFGGSDRNRHPRPGDPDLYLYQRNIKLKNTFFPENLQYTVQNIESFETCDAEKKDKTR
jgi:hypothetical protein